MRLHKRSITVFTLTLLVITTLMTFQDQAFAAEQGMSITATADEGSSTISISGHTANTRSAVTITITSPDGNNVVAVDQVAPNANGDFMTKIQTNSLLWKQDGFYKIAAQQENVSFYKLSVKVEVIGGKTKSTSVSQSSLIDLVTGGIVAPGPSRGLTLVIDAPLGATTITVSGHTDRVNTEVSIVVKAPNGNVVTTAQVTPNANGDFMTKIQTNSPLWKQNGFYTITAQQVNLPDYKASAQVEIVDGAVIPEFGTIAALILAVAIISIIAVSARSRLSILPKY